MNDITSRSNPHSVKLSILTYLMMFATGVAVVLPFVVRGSAAAQFHSTAAYTGYVFAFFMTGMLIGQCINGHVIKLMPLKMEIYLVGVVYIICVGLFYIVPSIGYLIPIFIIMGITFGVFVTIPFYLIVHMFEEKKRASRLNLMDFCFAIGSVAFPIIAGYMIQSDFNWKTIYLILFIVWIVIFVLLIDIKLPNVDIADEKTMDHHFSKWTFNSFLVGIAIFLAFVSFMGFNYNVINFLISSHHIAPEYASFSISLFWFLYGIGCFIATCLLKYIRVDKYILISSAIAFISLIFIYFTSNVAAIYIIISIFGLGCSTIYGSATSYGTELLKKPSPRLVSFYIASSGVGTMVAEFLSSYIGSTYGNITLIRLSLIFMIIVFLIILYVSLTSKLFRDKTNI